MCGSTTEFSTRILKQFLNNQTLIEEDTIPYSQNFQSFFFVCLFLSKLLVFSLYVLLVSFFNHKIVVEVCNFRLCSYFGFVVPVCDISSEEEGVLVQDGLERAERSLQEDQLKEGLATMVKIGESVQGCRDIEVLISDFNFSFGYSKMTISSKQFTITSRL